MNSDLKLEFKPSLWMQLNKDCFVSMERSPMSNMNFLTLFKFPIFYLFDHIIDKIGGCAEQIRTIIRKTFELDNFFCLDENGITDINASTHATILYRFIFNDRKYLYYSNSGLGIDNQLLDKYNHITACKILYFPESKSNLWKNISSIIKEIILVYKKISSSSYDDIIYINGERTSYKKSDEIWNELIQGIDINNLIDKKDFYDIVDFKQNVIYVKIHEKEQILCYALLNLFWSKNSDTITECTVNHLLNGDDHSKYKELIKKLIDPCKNLKYYIDNCCLNNINSEIYDDIIKLSNDKVQEDKFNNFIEAYKKKLFETDEKYDLKKTLKYKLVNSFELKFNNISGLYNNAQHSGSCTFYSYYNLAINMLLLNTYIDTLDDENQKLNILVNKFKDFHKLMIKLFCISNDTAYITNSSTGEMCNYDENNMYNYSFLYKEICNYDLNDEINNFYPKSTFILNPNKLLIDKKLNFNVLNVKLIKKNALIKLNNCYDIFIELFNYLDSIIKKIRNKDTINIQEEIYNKLICIFNHIEKKISNENNNIFNNSSKFNYKKNTLFLYSLAEIYIVNLILLINIYSTNNFKKVYTSNEKLKYLYYIEPHKISKQNDFTFVPVTELDFKECQNLYDKYTDKKTFYADYNYASLTFGFNLTSNINIDFLYNRLNIYEIYELSSLLNNNTINEINSIYKLKFKYCFCFAFKDISNDISNIINTKINFNIDFNYYFDKDNDYDDFKLEIIIIKYFIQYCYFFRNSKYNSIDKKIKNYLCKFIKKNIEKFLNVLNKQKILFSLFFLMISDSKYLLLVNELDTHDYFYINAVKEETEIYKINKGLELTPELQIKFNLIIDCILNNELNNDELNNKCILDFINYLGNTIDREKWINELDFNIVKTETNKYEYIYNNIKYYSTETLSAFNPLKVVLSRFGFHTLDLIYSTLLFPLNYLRRENDDEYNLSPASGELEDIKCFILLNKFKKCIEITFKAYIRYKVDTNNCFLFDKLTKNNKNKLLLNLNKEDHPFLSLIPSLTPYLCYEQNNTYYIEYIMSSAFCSDYRNQNYVELLDKHKILFNNGKNKYSFYEMNILKIAPSMIFPTIDSLNISNYNLLFDFYDTPNINLTSNMSHIRKKYIFINNPIYNKLENIIDSVNKILCEFVGCSKTNNQKFLQALKTELTNNCERRKVFNSFIEDNRLCDKYINEDNTYLYNYINNLKCYKKEIIDSIIVDNSKCIMNTFILDNFDKWIILMQINILINSFTSINENTNCWDILDILNILKSIKYFIKSIKSNFYYQFELLFLLQNEYFFKENQMIKYDEIRNDILSMNPNLKLHQFMMGKGKTSVFTPMLALLISIVQKKIPTIITMEHLVDQTKKTYEFISQILKLKINTFSDFDAKLRWIIFSDQELYSDIIKNLESSNSNEKLENSNSNKKLEELRVMDLKNEMNIIDEFDSHHNYLQSMFNYVRDEYNINEDLFNYIFTFVSKKIKNNDYQGDDNDNDIINPNVKSAFFKLNKNILNKNLNYFYSQSTKMIYNKDYGFSFLVLPEERDVMERLCSPFVRKDTPVKNSKFSSILLTLILTFKTYINKDYKLDDNDFHNLDNNKNIINSLMKYLSKDFRVSLNMNIDNKCYKIIKDEIESIYSNGDENIKKEILLIYLYEVNKNKINITAKQVNMSFQDIIYNNYKQWQVGYTGTTSLELNKYQPCDTFVFRDKLEDFDEKIEVKLALEGYGAPDSFKKNVLFIQSKDTIVYNIKKIINLLNDNPRGFVDLAGLFLDYSNEEIAKELKEQMKDKNIIFFNNNNIALEYNLDNNHTSHKPIDNNNFYYYDQCHTIGSDLKQPRIGHVAIIINNKTKMTDFSQAIFRFRKLNRGTYLSIILIENDVEDEKLKNNDKIYDMLIKNEDDFNSKQKDGIEYQLLKTMVRKESGQYVEDDIVPEFLKNKEFDRESIISYIKQNIKGLNTMLDSNIKQNDTHKFISNLYEKTIRLEEQKLISLIVGSGIESVKNTESKQEVKKQIEVEAEHDKEKEKINYSNLYKKFSKYELWTNNVIIHLNCAYCNFMNCIKLFKSDDVMINGKQIYISYNLFHIKFLQIDLKEVIWNIKEEKLIDNRFCYVEFNDKFIIEREDIGLNYYLYKLPVYNYKGDIFIKSMCNQNNKYKDKLNIDRRFIKMVGISNYTNPDIESEILTTSCNLKEIINNINDIALIILCNYIRSCRQKSRFNLHNIFINFINNIDVTKLNLDINFDEGIKHNEKEDLFNVCFNENNELKLNNSGYACIIPKNEFQLYLPKIPSGCLHFYNFPLQNLLNFVTAPDYKIFNREIKELKECFNIEKNSMQLKYLKYKKKYLDIKYKINNDF
jgi:hypothetical protein